MVLQYVAASFHLPSVSTANTNTVQHTNRTAIWNTNSLSTASCHVVTSNGVKLCGSKFQPTVSKHCQHQQCNTQTVQQYETPTDFLQHYAMWWHLMVLQYVAASFNLPSVSTAKTKTVQHTNRTAIWNPNNPSCCDIQIKWNLKY